MRKLFLLAISCLISAMSVVPGFTASFPSANVPDGLGVNLYYGGSVSTDLDLIRDAGFKYVRKDLHWHKVETSRGNYNWSQYDQLVDGAAARGMKMVFILCYNNTLYGASSVMNGITTSTQRTGFANFAKAAATRYKGKGVIFELWNEPNVGTFWRPGTSQTQYVDFAKVVGPAIKQADPNATVIGAALAWADPVWHEGLFSKGLLNYVDALSLHPYDKNQLPERWMNTYPYNYTKMRELIKKYNPANPNMPIISSEWGYSVTHPFLNGSEQAQANYIARCQLINLSMGVPLSIWFDFRNHDGTLEEGNYGIVRNDYSKKPAYYAIQNLTNSLRGTHFVRRISSTSSDYLMEFTNGTKTVVAAWTTGSSHSVTINGQSKTISGAPIYVTTGSSTTPSPTAPTAPSNCAVTSVTKGATTGNYYINLSWRDNSSNETGFQVQQSINSTSNFQTVKTVGAGVTTASADIGTSPAGGTFYYYRILAANGTVLSTASNTASTQVGIPNAPTTLALTQTRSSAGNYLVNLTWRDNSGIETGYKVLQSRSATTGFTTVKTIAANATSTTVDLGTAPSTGAYYYKVVAYSAMGSSASTNTVSARI